MLMVSRMDPGSMETVARLFAEHDRSNLPVDLGVTSRTLLHYQGMTMHLIQSEQEVFDNLSRLHQDPSFQELNRKLAPHMKPIVSDWRGIQDSRAVEFYHRNWT
ncbi:hypothetical protein GCM10009799_41600 [Nocardiopsis rhodophaea]|uniref:Uncharacterized protein n=2 Tax=Nocardiopsis rhodophaea TaxID=280238 RepID=A0ABN2TIS5_9ACTN